VSDVILSCEALRKSYGGIAATDDVSLEVERAQVHAVIGPNGAGKTTLISQLSGEVMPDAGRVRFNGRDITRLPAHRRSLIGLARSFQITSVFQNLTVLENVALAVQAHRGHSFRFWKPARDDAELIGSAREALEQVRLGKRSAEPARALSHGEHRQLEIAMALATDPALLLLDEPMAGMGLEESARMIETLKGLKGDKTMLLVEHDMDAVFALADRITVLVYGRVIASGAPDVIRADERVRKAYLGDEAA
jgi:branched-chain amino acid transport system ATP-binding protein